MPFTSSDLARRIEHAEAGILRAAAAAVKARRPEVTVETRDVAGGAAAFTGHGSPLNKLAGRNRPVIPWQQGVESTATP